MNQTRKRILAFLGMFGITLIIIISLNQSQIFLSATAQQRPPLTISAAISLSKALEELKTLYQKSTPNLTINYNFGASGALQQQIQQGAPVDIFFSAAVKQMDTLDRANLLLSGTRRNLLTNRLVLITPPSGVAISDFQQLTNGKIKRIAIGDPKSVPAGQYALEMLTKLGLWQPLQRKFVLGSNVRQVLTFVETGNVDAGIVYTTDAKESGKVTIRATASPNTHSPIIYPVAVIKDSRNPNAAKAFVQFLASDRALSVFQKYGFGIAR